MSSWDSIDQIGHRLKIKHPNGTVTEHIEIEYRVVYDTPNYVSYSVVVCVDGNYITLRSWSREKSSIDARNMSDSDVYDLFSSSIEKYITKITTIGITLRTWNKLMRNEGLL